MGDANRLHTKSSYADFSFSFPKPKSKTTIKANIASLRQKEIAFYNSFFPGCKTYESFIKKLRELFKNVDNDRDVLKAFKNANIIKEFERAGLKIGSEFSKENQKKPSIIITFEQDESTIDILNKVLKNLVSQKDVIISKSVPVISIKPEITSIKKTLNTLLSTHFRKENSKNVKNLREYIKNIENDIKDTGEKVIKENLKIVNVEGNIGTTSEKVMTEGIFSYKKEDIENPALKAEIELALKEVRFIINRIAGEWKASINMREAIQKTWDYSFSSEKARQAFFEKGGYTNYLKGAFGEFQLALINNYLDIVIRKNHLPSNMTSLISNTLKQEQDKSDVSLLRNIGANVETYNINAQVKNINIFSTDKINGNIHLDNLSMSMNTSSFEGFLANCFFNMDYQNQQKNSLHNLEICLENYFAEIMNLAISDSLEDKVTFYFIDGEYLVPGSRILSDKFVKSYVEITSDYKGLSNEEYMSNYRPRGKAPNYESQPFLKWWKPQKGGNHIFKPTEINDISEIFSHVSIRTSFFHGGKDNLSSFSIYG